MPGGIAYDMTDQLAPFQRSINGFAAPPGERLSNSPTA
jgi:hypothetical protein